MPKFGTVFIFVLIITSLSFPLSAQAVYPRFVTSYPKPTLDLGVPYHRQEHQLSCEAAALRMLLLNRGIHVSESDILEQMPFDPIGSDPNFVFVGAIDGRQNSSGYGIYWDALAHVTKNYSPAEAFHRKDLHYLIDRLHDGNPVVIWGSVTQTPKNTSWVTPGGKFIHALQGEHTWVVTGYSGPRRAPTHILTLDPIYGQRVFRTGDFLQNWAFFHNSGMFLKESF